MPRLGRGEYPLVAAVRWYIERIRGDADPGNVVSLQEARRRKTAAEAGQAELDLARAAGSLVAVDDVERMVGDMIANFRAKSLAIPTKAAPQLAPEKTIRKCRDILERFIHECLLELAFPGAGAPGGAGGDGAEDRAPDTDSRPAAQVDGKPMGRPGKKTKPRKQRRAR